MPPILSLTGIENKQYVYRGKDCMKRFSEFLTEHAIKIINIYAAEYRGATQKHM